MSAYAEQSLPAANVAYVAAFGDKVRFFFPFLPTC